MSKNNKSPSDYCDSTLTRWRNRFSYMEGQLLTIIDASIPNKDQCEAVKSLMRSVLWTSVINLEIDVRNDKIDYSGNTTSPNIHI